MTNHAQHAYEMRLGSKPLHVTPYQAFTHGSPPENARVQPVFEYQYGPPVKLYSSCTANSSEAATGQVTYGLYDKHTAATE